ncbi:ORF85 [Lymantria xylina nucleopolyhedrovirus]|uniref:ORF85 n=1 Tax=Lymantria xylina multiple nucleopolyhedrovirus TaxID=2847840 RepID=D4N2C2_9ABAC|nr:ORF85 [Lymantria xylina nucleopolyhedrovirus]ADD73794.1 ORF85 [Lymantria xylina nucleopolyhedrovirus]
MTPQKAERERPQPTPRTTCLHRLRNKDSTTLNRIKYDPELLLHYLFDNSTSVKGDERARKSNVNVLKISKVRVKKTCGALLTHYYAHITTSDGYEFEFHPGSQPRTFQYVHSDGVVVIVMIACDECCKNELRSFVEGENKFNVAFQNCESILCKRKSMQTVFVGLSLAVIVWNMFDFSWLLIFFVIFIVSMLYVNNNYNISSPRVEFCKHHSQNAVRAR